MQRILFYANLDCRQTTLHANCFNLFVRRRDEDGDKTEFKRIEMNSWRLMPCLPSARMFDKWSALPFIRTRPRFPHIHHRQPPSRSNQFLSNNKTADWIECIDLSPSKALWHQLRIVYAATHNVGVCYVNITHESLLTYVWIELQTIDEWITWKATATTYCWCHNLFTFLATTTTREEEGNIVSLTRSTQNKRTYSYTGDEDIPRMKQFDLNAMRPEIFDVIVSHRISFPTEHRPPNKSLDSLCRAGRHVMRFRWKINCVSICTDPTDLLHILHMVDSRI